jgi:diguanylate cyclase (GGDEF)-like protein
MSASGRSSPDAGPLADRVPPRAFADLTPLGTEVALAPGSVLWRQGDAADHVVLVLEGVLEVTHDAGGDEVVLRTLHPGAVAGEVAALDGRGRSATVRARTICRVLRVPASDFREFLRQRPDVLEELFWLQLERVRSLTRRVTRTHQRAITDPLTRLYNFGFFRDRLEIELERAHETSDPVALAIFDIDHFKIYNDANGHPEGNNALVKVAELLRKSGRRGDVVARYGGEEFAALLYGSSREEGLRFAETARAAVESHDFPGGAQQPAGRLTISAGVAAFPEDAVDDASLIRAADASLYRAKERGRNRVESAGG